jgi:hypothetical protein
MEVAPDGDTVGHTAGQNAAAFISGSGGGGEGAGLLGGVDVRTGASAPAVAGLEIHTGMNVVLQGLSDDDYNGLEGTVSGGINEKGRWVVQLRRGGSIAVKPANVALKPE